MNAPATPGSLPSWRAPRRATRSAFVRVLLGLCCGALASSALALEFRSVGGEPVILYDAPTVRGGKLYVAPRGMPVEVVVGQGDWLRVRDAAGDLAWVEKKALTERRNVVATTVATVRGSADAGGAALFQVPKGVLLELVEPATRGWVRVRHADGTTGYVSATEVWGE